MEVDQDLNIILDKSIEKLLDCKPITEKEVKQLCLKAKEIFASESNV